MCFFTIAKIKKLSSTINLSALIWSIKAALKSEISWEAKSVNVGSVIYFSFMIKNHVESTDKSFSQNAQRCSGLYSNQGTLSWLLQHLLNPNASDDPRLNNTIETSYRQLCELEQHEQSKMHLLMSYWYFDYQSVSYYI